MNFKLQNKGFCKSKTVVKNFYTNYLYLTIQKLKTDTKLPQ